MPELVTTATATRTLAGEDRVRITGGGHVALFTRLAPGMLLVTERGTQTPETRALMIREVEAEISASAPVPVAVFIDVRASSRMDAGGREEWSNFGKRRKNELQGVVVLVQSKLLEMAFSIMAMFLGGGAIRIVSSEDQFLNEIRQKGPRLRTLPTV
jgi:hypothetical protein